MRIRAVWSESPLGAFWIAKNAKIHDAENEDSDETADAPVDLSLRMVHVFGTFSHVAAYLCAKWHK